MKTNKLILCVCSISMIAQLISAQGRNTSNFTLTGKIKDQQMGKVTLGYMHISDYKTDSATIKNGQFSFKGYITEPTMAWLTGDGDSDHNSTIVWLEPGKMEINLTKDHYETSILIGSKTQTELYEYNKFTKPATQKRDEIRGTINMVKDLLYKEKSQAAKDDMSKRIDILWSKWNQENDKIPALSIQFVKSHPKSFISANRLEMLEKNDKIQLDSLISIFNGLDSSVQNGRDGKVIGEDIRKKNDNRIGAIAPDFNVLDRNNKYVKLSDFKGKSVVLLDFWASWCVPCRQSFKSLKPLYNRLHSKGFDVVAIDTDHSRNDKAWDAAIAKDSIAHWYHVKVAKEYPFKINGDDIYSKYFVQGIPRKILIDKNGIVIGNWVGTSEEIENELIKKKQKLL